jgi:DNA polymerase II large subunit
MNDNVESNKAQQELRFKSEKIFLEKLSKLIEECRAEDLDVGTVLDQLLHQSLSLVFRFTHTVDDAVDIVKIALDQMLDEHLPESSDEIDFIDSKNIHQIH